MIIVLLFIVKWFLTHLFYSLSQIVPSHGVVYVPISGEEKNSSTYEYLVRPNYGSLEWVPSADGVIPSGAVNGGHTSSQEPLFIG